jgi:GNAT superfamily N-acetyltransferase
VILLEFIGRGLGAALLTSAIEEAWSPESIRGIEPERVWVHTCNRDHPQALANYQARGMIVYKIEESRRENIYEKMEKFLFRVRGSAH